MFFGPKIDHDYIPTHRSFGPGKLTSHGVPALRENLQFGTTVDHFPWEIIDFLYLSIYRSIYLSIDLSFYHFLSIYLSIIHAWVCKWGIPSKLPFQQRWDPLRITAYLPGEHGWKSLSSESHDLYPYIYVYYMILYIILYIERNLMYMYANAQISFFNRYISTLNMWWCLPSFFWSPFIASPWDSFPLCVRRGFTALKWATRFAPGYSEQNWGFINGLASSQK